MHRWDSPVIRSWPTKTTPKSLTWPLPNGAVTLVVIAARLHGEAAMDLNGVEAGIIPATALGTVAGGGGWPLPEFFGWLFCGKPIDIQGFSSQV